MDGPVVAYLCGECNSRVSLKRGDQIRCKECGHRVLYKERTKRLVFPSSFFFLFSSLGLGLGWEEDKCGNERNLWMNVCGFVLTGLLCDMQNGSVRGPVNSVSIE